MIPAHIHQTWKNADVPDRYREAAQSWRSLHPDWQYTLWTDASMERFTHEHYPHVKTLWNRYPDQIQRVDVFRYLVLHHQGGFYADLDVGCVSPFDDLRCHDAVLPATEPVGLSNDLMGFAPGHPLLEAIIDALPEAFKNWQRPWIPRHFRVLCSTGSLHLSRVHSRYRGPGDVRILSPALYNGREPSRMVYHLPGNTWAGWDTHLLTFCYRAWKSLVPNKAFARRP